MTYIINICLAISIASMCLSFVGAYHSSQHVKLWQRFRQMTDANWQFYHEYAATHSLQEQSRAISLMDQYYNERFIRLRAVTSSSIKLKGVSKEDEDFIFTPFREVFEAQEDVLSANELF